MHFRVLFALVVLSLVYKAVLAAVESDVAAVEPGPLKGAVGATKRGDGDRVDYGVALTTIPSRFRDIHHTIRSWMSQKGGPPRQILIFIPKQYFRFKAGSKEGSDKVEFIEVARRLLGVKFKTYVNNGRIKFLPVREDYGPLTKFSGLLENWKEVRKYKVDTWVVGDDDVFYSHTLLAKYSAAITAPSYAAERDVLTHFSEDERVFIRLEGEDQARALRHVQGVDTFAVSSALIRAHMEDHKGALFYPKFIKMVKFFHKTCPESFFQDDYLLSFAFNIAGLQVQSLWDDERVAGHVDGVSKSNNQMHMMTAVHDRETITKECVTLNADAAAKILTKEWVRRGATEEEEL